jgi:hypothetical protein
MIFSEGWHKLMVDDLSLWLYVMNVRCQVKIAVIVLLLTVVATLTLMLCIFCSFTLTSQCFINSILCGN